MFWWLLLNCQGLGPGTVRIKSRILVLKVHRAFNTSFIHAEKNVEEGSRSRSRFKDNGSMSRKMQLWCVMQPAQCVQCAHRWSKSCVECWILWTDFIEKLEMWIRQLRGTWSQQQTVVSCKRNIDGMSTNKSSGCLVSRGVETGR